MSTVESLTATQIRKEIADAVAGASSGGSGGGGFDAAVIATSTDCIQENYGDYCNIYVNNWQFAATDHAPLLPVRSGLGLNGREWIPETGEGGQFAARYRISANFVDDALACDVEMTCNTYWTMWEHILHLKPYISTTGRHPVGSGSMGVIGELSIPAFNYPGYDPNDGSGYSYMRLALMNPNARFENIRAAIELYRLKKES